jgi:hypothetical protein
MDFTVETRETSNPQRFACPEHRVECGKVNLPLGAKLKELLHFL